MSSFYNTVNNFLNNGKNLYKTYFFLVVFLCAVKLPSLITSDIQPWDEGMYATRVLSIHTFGDFIDQSSHSVGKFYSASHPPLLIWIGYFITLVFGINSIVLKLIIFIFSLLCVLLILQIGKNLFSFSTGFYAALIFCSNVIFTVFSQRFQLDIPYTFFILLSFYLLFRYNETLKIKFILLSGFAFGCCLMTKILVGLYIPIILFISYFFIKDKVNFKLKDLIILTSFGIILALPWHIYMLATYGSEFTDFFFKFHIYDRALQGVEMNEKSSGMFFHVNYLLSIIPYSILVFPSVLKDFLNYKKLSWQKIFIDIWLITGLVIITAFRTKLEVYVLIILVPACFLIPLFIKELNNENRYVKIVVVLITLLNVIWFASESIRPGLKFYAMHENIILILFYFILIFSLLFFLSSYIADIIELKKTFYIFIFIFFFMINIYYLIFIPDWVNGYRISALKEQIELCGKKKIVYVSSNYRYNPQFSFYFNGLNLGWKDPEYEFELIDKIDDKDNFNIIKTKLNSYSDKDHLLILEKDGINRAPDFYPELFIPYFNTLTFKSKGYELYEKMQ